MTGLLTKDIQMNFCVFNIYSENIKQVAELTIEQNKRAYCNKHGYDHIIVKDNQEKFHTNRDYGIPHYGYEKIGMALELISSGKYDWIFWCGSDTMITNFNISLDELIDNDYEMVVANDLWGINADSILFRASDKSVQFLTEVYESFPDYVDGNGVNYDHGIKLPDGSMRGWAEQGAISDLIKHDEWSSTVKRVPQKVMNSYLYHMYPSQWHSKGVDCNGNDGRWSKGDFLLHLPGMVDSTRIRIINDVMKEIVGND